MTMTLDDLIARHARSYGHRTAVQYAEKSLNWKQFYAFCNRIAHAFRDVGLEKHAKVATVLPNSLELLALYWAITSLGAVVVPLSPLLNPAAIVKLLRSCEAFSVVIGPEHEAEIRRELQTLGIHARVLVHDETDRDGNFRAFSEGHPATPLPPAEVQPEDLFNIVYSSGTTGEPKGIEHSHLVRAQYAAHFAAAFRMTPESVVLHTGSIVFNGAFCTLMPCFYLGARYILHPLFDVDTLIATVRKQKVTHVMMVSAQIIALLEHPDLNPSDLASLEMVLSLGAPLYREHKDRFMALLPGRLYELYGLTEGFVTILDKNDVARKPGSVGCPPPGFRMRIVDENGQDLPAGKIGEIVGDGPIRMSGYHGRPDLTAATVRDGWIHTGDMGHVDEEGFLYLVDRKKDMIISGGVNVYPRDIEDVIVRHPEVVETAVFATASKKWGETPVAAVILRRDSRTSAAALKEWVNQRVDARYQRLSDIMLVEEFPRNAAGKTLKRTLKEAYSARG